MHKNAKRTISFVLAFLMALALIPLGQVEAATLRQGSEGSEVKHLQQNLIGLGYLDGKADGSFGDITKDAVLAFQADYGLRTDGVAGNATQTALRNTVVRLQAELKDLGCAPGSADGYFGSKTSNAVKTFQSWLGQNASGIAGGAVRSQIDSRSSGMVSGTAVRKGSSGTQVRYLQMALIGLGFLSGSADGQYGPATSDAVSRYQAAYGLTSDGSAGPKTMTSLKNTIAALQSDMKIRGWYSGSIDGVYGNNTKSAVKAYQSHVGISDNGVAGAKTMEKLYGYALGEALQTQELADQSYKIWIDPLYQNGDTSKIYYGYANSHTTTVSTSGCAGVALAMAVNALKNSDQYTGRRVMQWLADNKYYEGSGTEHDGIYAYAYAAGLQAAYCGSADKLAEHLKKGRLALALIRDITKEALFTYSGGGGHYILISGYRVKDGVKQVFVNNPLSYKSSRWFDMDDLMANSIFRQGLENPFVVIYN